MNTFGNKFRVSIFGESHGPRIGVTVDGVLPGIPLGEADFEKDLSRRKAGALGTTPRLESDLPEIVSGVYEGRTTGAPLTILFKNENTRSQDYEQFRKNPRPGQADFTANLKFGGFNDPRGGGHFSGRLTLGIVAAGVIAKKMLYFAQFGARLVKLGGFTDASAWPEALKAAQEEGDSLGGVVECTVEGVPIGLGEPFWNSVESQIAHAIFAIPGVRGIEFGDGFAASDMKGSEHNDPFPEHHCHHEGEKDHECCHGEGGCHHEEGEGHHCCGRHKRPQPPVTNHAGGVNGGITNGNPLVFRVAFKPTSSIAKAGIPGRHDVCFALRTPVIVEAMAAIVLVDLAL
ncbi:MAG: chorismate synthase [Bacteroidales bacterium]|nr:chorismate synthase [Bacteroidales bacterium]MBQ9701613.1 chorismate synthase [Bacteroidales bacterium]